MAASEDIDVVSAVRSGDENLLRTFYLSCRIYFATHASAVLHPARHSAREAADIFQDAFLRLWSEIESRRIYIRGDALWRTDRKGRERPMTAGLRTYLMAIARYRNLEVLREEEIYGDCDAPAEPSPDEPEDLTLEEIAMQCIDNLSPRCRDILTRFYFHGQDLDSILAGRPGSVSKDGLKSAKYKCMARLREAICREINRRHLKMPNNGKQ